MSDFDSCVVDIATQHVVAPGEPTYKGQTVKVTLLDNNRAIATALIARDFYGDAGIAERLRQMSPSC